MSCPTTSDIPSLCQILQRADATKSDILDAITGFRRMVSGENNLPVVRQIIDANVLPIIVHLLTYNDEGVQFEAAWVLTNIAATELTRAVVDNGAVPLLVQMLVSGNPDIREQSAWCLANIAGDSAELRDMVLESGAMSKLLTHISDPAGTSYSLLSNAVWALYNFCRGTPKPSLEKVEAAIPYLEKLVKYDSQIDPRIQEEARLTLTAAKNINAVKKPIRRNNARKMATKKAMSKKQVKVTKRNDMTLPVRKFAALCAQKPDAVAYACSKYQNMTKAQLRSELRRNNVNVTGSKDYLMMRAICMMRLRETR